MMNADISFLIETPKPTKLKASRKREKPFAFLASGFSCAHSLKSAFSSACKGPSTLHDLVISRLFLFHLLQDAIQVVGFRGLQRRELLKGIEFLVPQLLANRQHVPVV